MSQSEYSDLGRSVYQFGSEKYATNGEIERFVKLITIGEYCYRIIFVSYHSTITEYSCWLKRLACPSADRVLEVAS